MSFRLVTIALNIATMFACSQSASPRNSSTRTSPLPSNGPAVNRTGGKSCLQIVNGLPTKDFPTVVRLVGLRGNSVGVCTGTFISPTAVITAAHCIDSSSNGGLSIVPGDRLDFSRNPLTGATKALRAFTLGSIGSTGNTGSSEVVGKDTAILLFPSGIAKGYSEIATGKPSVGTKAASVGYGLQDYFDDETAGEGYDASKHFGSIDVVNSGDELNIYVGDYTAAESERVLGAKVVDSMGDSGGPLFVNGKITGTLSVGGARERATDGESAYFSVFVDINSANTRKLIQIANAGGANIPPPGTAPTNLSAPDNSTAATTATDNDSTCQ
ncbi:MAG: hypothetical protein RL011_462 [Pseudomonadota bacterium]